MTTCGVAHTVDLACGAAEDQRCVMCSIEVKGGTDIENNRRKRKSTSTHHRFRNPFLCAEFQRRLWAFAPKPGSSVSDHAEELSRFLEACERCRQPWISNGTWCTVKVIAPLRRLANQARECGRFSRMKCYFAAWMASKPCEFAPGHHLQGPGRGWMAYGMHQEWTRKAARSFYLASALWVQADRLKRMAKPVIIADKLAFLEWNAKEALASNGDSHYTYQRGKKYHMQSVFSQQLICYCITVGEAARNCFQLQLQPRSLHGIIFQFRLQPRSRYGKTVSNDNI